MSAGCVPWRNDAASAAALSAAVIPSLSRRPEGDPLLLTADEEASLARRIEAGDMFAREEMIARNLRLVTHIARTYEGYTHGALALDDLIQEGRVGLIRAVDRYDHRRGCRFSTYASHWITQAITRAVDDQYRTIRVPAYAGQLARRAARRFTELTRELGREPSDEEFARELGVSADRIAEIMAAARPTLSLDAPMQVGDDAVAMSEFLEDGSEPPILDAVHNAMVGERIRCALSQLSPRERQIIARRFGLGAVREQTLSEVGGDMKMTRERVRQIEKRALKKLKLALGPDLAD